MAVYLLSPCLVDSLRPIYQGFGQPSFPKTLNIVQIDDELDIPNLIPNPPEIHY